MQTKQIDTKYKEIYFTSRIVEEDRSVLNARTEFWNSMSMYAIRNIPMIYTKRA